MKVYTCTRASLNSDTFYFRETIFTLKIIIIFFLLTLGREQTAETVSVGRCHFGRRLNSTPAIIVQVNVNEKQQIMLLSLNTKRLFTCTFPLWLSPFTHLHHENAIYFFRRYYI